MHSSNTFLFHGFPVYLHVRVDDHEDYVTLANPRIKHPLLVHTYYTFPL
jgi:hypothetical protein